MVWWAASTPLRRVLQGALQSDSWLCLQGLERLGLEVLSLVGAQLQAIWSAYFNGLPAVHLPAGRQGDRERCDEVHVPSPWAKGTGPDTPVPASIFVPVVADALLPHAMCTWMVSELCACAVADPTAPRRSEDALSSPCSLAGRGDAKGEPAGGGSAPRGPHHPPGGTGHDAGAGGWLALPGPARLDRRGARRRVLLPARGDAAPRQVRDGARGDQARSSPHREGCGEGHSPLLCAAHIPAGAPSTP